MHLLVLCFTFTFKEIIPYVQLLQEDRSIADCLRSCSKHSNCQNAMLDFLTALKGVAPP